jgi:hypothetical protein
MKRFKKISKVIALVNSFHSLASSDHTENPEVVKAMRYCDSEVKKLCGVASILELPYQMDELIKYLKQ